MNLYNKDNTEIKLKDVPNLFQKMKKLWYDGDIDNTLLLADKLLEIRNISSHVLYAILEIYLDCKKIDKFEKAAEALKCCKSINGYGYFLLGRVELFQKRYCSAISYGKKSLADKILNGDRLAEVYDMLGEAYRKNCEPEKSAEYHLRASQIAVSEKIKLSAYSNYLFSLHYTEKKASFMLEEAQKYQDILSNVIPYKHSLRKAVPPVWSDTCRECNIDLLNSYSSRKLKIGYLSADFRKHVVAEFVQAFIRNYDKYNFEIYIYSTGAEDSVTEKMKQLPDKWYNLQGYSYRAIAEQIYQDKIDILVELGGHTANNNLPVLAYKPAPVQICGIGYFGSTGLDTVDYFMGDKYLDEEASAEDFLEKFIRLSDSHWCYHPLETEGTGLALPGTMYVGDPSATAIAPFQENGYITFGCLNDFSKLNIKLLGLWREILTRVPHSKIFFKGNGFVNYEQSKIFYKMLSEAGIDYNKIIVEGYDIHYMTAYNRVDIALDTYPYVGGGTTCDALYMGIPVISLYGSTHHSRFGYSALMNIGLSECCAVSESDYIEKTVALANDTKHLKYLHKILRYRMEISPLMDKGKYMADLESEYFTIWQKYLGIKLPETNHFYTNFGYSYMVRRDHDRAEWWIKKAIAAGGDNIIELYCYLSNSAKERVDSYGAWKNVEAAYQQLKYEENKGTVGFQNALLNNRGNFAKAVGRIDEALESYWQTVELAENLDEKSFAYDNYLYTLLCTNASKDTVALGHYAYNDIFSDLRRNLQNKNRIISFGKHEKIRVGYISPDFRQHVMFSFYYSLLAAYDKNKFQVTCYQLAGRTDGYTEHLKGLVDVWCDLSGLSFQQMAEKIHADEIDILVNLAGHTAYGALPVFVYRPAPVQISGLGWMETTGLAETDYFITDKLVDPPQDNYLSEKPLYLPSQFCYTAREDVPVPQGAACLATGQIIFAVFNNYYKYDDYILGAWKRILNRLPKARLLLKCQLFTSLSAMEMAFERFHKLGFDMDRVAFEPATNNYMLRYLSVDIALDTYPYPGGGTTCDALYMGVPVISLYGKRRGSRFGYSILENIGLGELATDDIDDYVEKAVALAQDYQLLDMLHKNIRNMMIKSPVMDSRLYVRNMENTYTNILRKRKN